MDSNTKWEELFKKYLQNGCTDEEIEILMLHLDEQYLQEKSLNELVDLNNSDKSFSEDLFKDKVLRITEHVEERLLQEILSKRTDKVIPNAVRPRLIKLYWAAALILFCLSFSGLYVFYNLNSRSKVFVKNEENIFTEKKTLLKLSDGRLIDLETVNIGESISEVGYFIKRNLDGAFVYLADPTQQAVLNSNAFTLLNRIDIPSGKQVHFILPDGSNVWLNAQSSLEFPVNFPKNERFVELTGEGYFEVVKDAKKPFRVYTDLKDNNRQLIEVYGTRFNVCAYTANKGIQTSLLEGSVSVSLASEDKVPDLTTQEMLKPMEQAMVFQNEIKVSASEADEAVSWVKGYFHFNETPLESILGRLSRWYDVEFIYAKDMIDLNYSGTLPKNIPLSKVLELLQTNNKVHFLMEGRRVRVLN